MIDTEFFSIRVESLPESNGIQHVYEEIYFLATSKDERIQGEGRVHSTLNQIGATTLIKIAELIFDLYEKFSHFMQHGAPIDGQNHRPDTQIKPQINNATESTLHDDQQQS